MGKLILTVLGAGIAIFQKENFVLRNQYSANPPEIVIEIDTKVELDSAGVAIEYYQRKNIQLFEFGVKKSFGYLRRYRWLRYWMQTVAIRSLNGTRVLWGWRG